MYCMPDHKTKWARLTSAAVSKNSNRGSLWGAYFVALYGCMESNYNQVPIVVIELTNDVSPVNSCGIAWS